MSDSGAVAEGVHAMDARDQRRGGIPMSSPPMSVLAAMPVARRYSFLQGDGGMATPLVCLGTQLGIAGFVTT